MDQMMGALRDEFERSLSFHYHSGGVLQVAADYSTGWRTLPFSCCAQTDYTSLIQLTGQRLELRPLEACVIGAGVRHRIEPLGRRAGISRFAHFSVQAFGCIDALALLEVPIILRDAPAERIGQLAGELAAITDVQADDPRVAIRRTALGFALLRTIADASALRAQGPSQLEAVIRLRPIYAHIQAHLGDRIALGGLARIAGLSPSRFHAVFKAIAGLAPQRFVQRSRMQKAQQLLIETDASVKDLAAKVGHPDEFHFSRTFKRHCGMSPAQYRRMARTWLFAPVPGAAAPRA